MNIKIFLNELCEIISSIQNEIINSVRDHKAHTELDSYINSLKTNPYSIANITNQIKIKYLLIRQLQDTTINLKLIHIHISSTPRWRINKYLLKKFKHYM